MKRTLLSRAADPMTLDRLSTDGPPEVAATVLSTVARGGSGWAATSMALGLAGGDYRRAGVEGLAAWSAAEAVAAGMKHLTSRSRPRRPRGRRARSSSLPSSHTAAGIAYAVAAGTLLGVAIGGSTAAIARRV